MNTKILVIIVAGILVVSGIGIAIFVLNNDDNSRITIDVDLEVFGNADKDSKVDAADAKLIKDYIDAVAAGNDDKVSEIEKSLSKDFADANQDGKIDSKDIDQINGILNRTASHIWILDGNQNIRKVNANPERIGCEYYSNTELCLVLGLADRVVAVDNAPYIYKDFYFTAEQQKNLQNMVNCSVPDYDLINSMDLDTYLLFSGSSAEKEDKIIDCDVLYLGFYLPDMTNTSKSNFIQGILKAGYIFDAVDRAEKYVEWILGWRDKLLDLSNSIPEADKPVVGMSNYTANQFFQDDSKNTTSLYKDVDPLGQALTLGGGRNIIEIIKAAPISSSTFSISVQVDAILNDDPTVHVDYFFLHMVKYTYGASINAGVPDHGYIDTDRTEINAAYQIATNHSLLTDENIHLIAGDFRNGCSGGVLLGAYIGKIINPDVYKDIDPIQIHNEFVAWMGIEGYNVATDGIFIAPMI